MLSSPKSQTTNFNRPGQWGAVNRQPDQVGPRETAPRRKVLHRASQGYVCSHSPLILHPKYSTPIGVERIVDQPVCESFEGVCRAGNVWEDGGWKQISNCGVRERERRCCKAMSVVRTDLGTVA